jgi:catechol 2,3-dioxygenase-like lactoylglutathione lyase family enzyme
MSDTSTAPQMEETRTSWGLRQIFAKLPAQDVERARAFFADNLELHPVAELNQHLHYEVDGSYFIIFPSNGPPSGTHDQLGLVVDDVHRCVSKLQANGVVFEYPNLPPSIMLDNEIADFGEVRAAWFKDSEGNLISVNEFLGGSPFGRRVSRTTTTRS